MDTITIIQESQPTKKVDISLRQLIDIDETGGIVDDPNVPEGKIKNNQILTGFAELIDPETRGKVKSFRFKNLTDLLLGGNGVTISTDKDGITTISNSGVRKIIAGTNVTISPVSGLGDVTINSTGGGGGGGGDMLKSVYDTDNDGIVDKAETVQIIVRNSTGVTLTKGQVVYLLGATGNRPNAVLANATTEATSSKTIGLVSANILDNADGNVTISGSMHDLALNMYAAGDRLWLSTTPGGMVANTPPAEPNHSVFIGTVARAHPTQGRIVLAIQNGYELDELHGVLITTPANNEVLTYESSTSLWKNKTIATALGYTPVPTTRNLTINGTTQDLSADRTFTIATGLTIGTTPITSGTIGRVLFEGTGNVLQQSANLFWDNTNLRLDVIGKISTQQATFPAFAANGSVMVGGSNVSGTAGVLLGVQIPYVSGAFGGHTIGYSNQTNPKWLIGISRNLPQENALVYYEDSAAASARLAIFPGGNVGINTTTDAGFKLDVSGTARVSSTMGVGGAFVTGSSGFGNTILSLTSSYPCLILNSTSGTASKVGLNLDSSKLYISEETNGSLNWGHRIMVNTKVGGLVVLNNTAAGSIAALNASAVLQADSTTRGFLPPRMTTTQKNAIATPASGLVVYDTTLNTLNFYNGTTWADGSQVLPGNSLYLFYNY